jgi:hypothetical protein
MQRHPGASRANAREGGISKWHGATLLHGRYTHSSHKIYYRKSDPYRGRRLAAGKAGSRRSRRRPSSPAFSGLKARILTRCARPFAFLPSSATSPAVRTGRRSPSDRSQAPSLARSPSSCRRTASDGSKGPWRPTLNVSVAAIPTADWGANLKGASPAVGRRIRRRRDGRSSCKALARPCLTKINDYELGKGEATRGEIVEIAGRPEPLQAQARHASMRI